MNRRELSPALIGSVALHAAVAAALLIAWPWSRDLKIGSAVPVTIVTNAPAAELAPAIEAPEPQAAQTEQPAPEAPPEVQPPAPQPTPQPPAPQPKPQPQPKPTPTPPKPAPAPASKPTPKPAPKAEKSLDLDALAASVSKMAKPSSAAKGPTRAATAPQARTGQGAADSAAAMTGLVDELQRRWNPNCGVAEGRQVVVKVTFRLNAGGGVVGEPRAQIVGADNAASRVGADRAVSAVYAAAPFRNLPRQLYGENITVNFNAREACS